MGGREGDAVSEDMSAHCLRCGTPIDRDCGSGIERICWPPGRADYFVRHLFSKRAEQRRTKRDQEKLDAWKANSAKEMP